MGTYQSNSRYLEAFKSHLKVIKAHNFSMGYHPSLDITSLLEKHNMTSETAIFKNIGHHQGKLEIHLTCLCLIGSDNLM